MPISEFEFNPTSGFNDTVAYPNPTSGAEARQQLQSLHNQTRDYINNTLIPAIPSVGGYAPINSPDLKGTPKAPTAPTGTNTTQIATTAFVQNGLNGRALTSQVLLKSKVTLSGTTLTIDLT